MAEYSSQGLSASMGMPYFCSDMCYEKGSIPDGMYKTNLCEWIGGVLVDHNGVAIKSEEGNWGKWHKEFTVLASAVSYGDTSGIQFKPDDNKGDVKVIWKRWFVQYIKPFPELNNEEVLREIYRVSSVIWDEIQKELDAKNSMGEGI